MKYVDMHCDTLTACFDAGAGLADKGFQASYDKLNKSGCAAQCFAVFTQGDGSALRFEKYLSFFGSEIKRLGIKQILCPTDLDDCIRSGKTGAILTVENLGFIDGDLKKAEALSSHGVKMASLVWNYENSLAMPNLKFADGVPLFSERESGGLTSLGEKTVEILDALKIIIDISHLSDGGALQILKNRKIPLVASHSNAAAVCGVARNLTDSLIKEIADCGGVIGVNYCKDFLGRGATFADLLAHVKHIVNVGGEDAVALGSDFDGIPAPPDLEDCLKVPALLQYLQDNLGYRLTRKLRHENFTRVFRAVCG